MRLTTLRISNLRNIVDLELRPGAGFTALVGPNGAGKTSILEGAYLLAHAQSFRPGTNESLIRSSAGAFVLHARVERQNGPVQVGLSRESGAWKARVNNTPVSSLSALLSEFALVCLEPGSHALISGGSAGRRRFMDWGVFHVEPEHLRRMRDFRRALRQRNALLKQGRRTGLDVWDEELARLAEPLAASRTRYFAQFARIVSHVLQQLLPELGQATLHLNQGWPSAEPLIEILAQVRTNDLMRGHTTRGPHRADWTLRFEHAQSREYLSRGQEKLCALACVMGQAQMFAAERGEWPVVALDDLASELDADHQRFVVDLLIQAGAQVIVTGTELPPALRLIDPPISVFHVEHGGMRSLL
jgi:DNA replication and repair protein RecF